MSQSSSSQNRMVPILVFLFVAVFAAILFLRYSPWGTPEQVAQPDVATFEGEPPLVEMMVESGPVTLLLRPDLAPLHVERITNLAELGFYDEIVFHRVIEGFMAQTGDPTGTGMGGSELPDLPAEFSEETFLRGTIGMARSQALDSANSQFFIVFQDAPHLDGQYTIVGSVIEGMEHIDELKKGSPASNGSVTDPDHIVSMRVLTTQ